MNIDWSPESVQDLINIRQYISQDDAKSAKFVVQTVLEFAEHQLSHFPKSGRKGRVEGTLELTIPRLPFVVPYRVKNGGIEIIRVYHTSRQWPEEF